MTEKSGGSAARTARALVAICIAVPAGAAAAADASAWRGDRRAEFRLLAGERLDNGTLRAGVEIRLAAGWKTYWRYPGDSGVPPAFDFTGSDNVKAVALSYPAPRRFADADGVTIGYKENVLFPLRVAAKEAGRPVVLRLKLDYAICEKLCIPVQGAAELTLPPGGGAQGPAIASAEKSVPQPRALGADAALAIRSAQRDDGTKPARILLDVAAPANAGTEVFVEGPTPDWSLPVPEPVAGAATGMQRFAFALDGLPPGASVKGAALRITAVAGAEAIETTMHLDEVKPSP